MCYAQYKQEGITENSVLDLAKFCEEDRPTNTLKLNGDSSSVNSSLIYEKKINLIFQQLALPISWKCYVGHSTSLLTVEAMAWRKSYFFIALSSTYQILSI